MSRRPHFLEADDGARQQNLRFVRNPEDDFQQFFDGPLGVSAPPRDYKVVTPKPGNYRDNLNNMNTLEERAQYLYQLGLPKYEAYGLAERSFKTSSFNLDYFKNRNVNIPESTINMPVFEKTKNALRQPLNNDFTNNRFNENFSILSRPKNVDLSCNAFPRSPRPRSPLNFMRWGSSQQQPLNFPASREYNHSFSKNNSEMTNLSNRDGWQTMSIKNFQTISQNVFRNSSSNQSFNEVIQPPQLNNRGYRNLCNQSEIEPNHQFTNGQFQGFNNNSFGPMSHFNQNNFQNNDQQSPQFNMGSILPRFQQTTNNFDVPSNSNNSQDFDQIRSHRSNQFFQDEPNELQDPYISQDFDQIRSHRSNQCFQDEPNELQDPLGIISLLQNPNFQKFVQKAEQFQQYSQELESRNIPEPHIRKQMRDFRGTKHRELKRTPINNTKKINLKNLQNKNVLNKKNLVSNKQIIMHSPRSKSIQNVVEEELPPQKMSMPSRKNWVNWWRGKVSLEKKVMFVNDKDPEIMKTFSAENMNKPNEITQCLNKCRRKMVIMLRNAREKQVYEDAYDFLKCKVLFHELLIEYKGRGIAQSERKACEKLLRQITVVDMILYYKALIRKWKSAYGTENTDQPRGIVSLGKLINQKVFNWLVRLAFKELKRISNPIRHPPKKSEKELKELHVFSTQLPLEKKEKLLHFDLSQNSAEEIVRSSIKRLKEYLKKGGNVDVLSSKNLVLTRIRLTDKSLDSHLSANLKQQKDDLLDKLKTDSYAKQNYEFLIEETLKMREIVLNLQEADPRLILPCERKVKSHAKRFIMHSELKVAINFLLDERLKEYGAYLTEGKVLTKSEETNITKFAEMDEHDEQVEDNDDDVQIIEDEEDEDKMN